MHTSPATFQADVIESPVPVFVIYTAPWCTVSAQMTQKVKDFVETLDGRVKLQIYDVGPCVPIPDTPDKIQMVPTLVVYCDGKPQSGKSGYLTDTDLVTCMFSALLRG